MGKKKGKGNAKKAKGDGGEGGAEDPAALMEAELSSSKAKLSETMATISYVHAERGAVCLVCLVLRALCGALCCTWLCSLLDWQ